MKPESTSAILRPDLTAQVQEYNAIRAASRFIGLKIAPLFRSNAASATYPIMRRANFKKPTSTKRGPRGNYNRIQGVFGTGTFNCEDNGLEYPVDDQLMRKSVV